MTVANYPGSSRQTPPFDRGSVEQAKPNVGLVAPGLPARIQKRIIRQTDIPQTGSGLEVNLNLAGEVAFFSDFPVQVSIDTPDYFSEAISDFRLSGQINRLFIRTFQPSQHGRLVIYEGRPSLGVGFARENAFNKSQFTFNNFNGANPIVWALGSTVANGAAFTIPGLWQAQFTIREAVYITEFYLSRTSGLITGFYYVESETGTSQIIWYPRFAPAGAGTVRERLAVPVRIAASGNFVFEGTSEPGNTDLTMLFHGVSI